MPSSFLFDDLGGLLLEPPKGRGKYIDRSAQECALYEAHYTLISKAVGVMKRMASTLLSPFSCPR